MACCYSMHAIKAAVNGMAVLDKEYVALKKDLSAIIGTILEEEQLEST